MNDVPIWALGLIVGGAAVLLGIAGFFLWRWVWHRASRRYLVRLISRKASLEASRKTLETVLKRLAEDSDEALMEFAEDVDSLDRRVLAEEHQRCVVLCDELQAMPMPKALVPAADALADAAEATAEEAGRVRDDQDADQALESLQAVDLERVGKCFDEADELIDEACEYYGVDEAETAVYGGGLYI